MDIIKIGYIVNIVLILLMVIGLGFFLTWKFKIGWRLFFVGGATYMAAQILSLVVMGLIQSSVQSFTPTLPVQLLLSLVFLMILLSIEEGIRYAMYRWWAKDVRSWTGGLMVGSGHGGMEVILIGFSALYKFVQLLPLRYADLAKLYPDQLQEATKLVHNYWSAPLYKALSEAVRSGLTLPIQLACSLLVLQVFLRGQYRWLGYAVVWHTLASLPVYFVNPETYVLLQLAFLAIASIISVVLILRLRPRQEQAIEIAR